MYGVPGVKLGIVKGDATAPDPKLVQVVPASVVHSYDSIDAPPFEPAVNEIDIVVVVTAIDVIVGADGTMALTTKLLETFVATRWFVASGAEAVRVQVPANTIVTLNPLTVQTLVVALVSVTLASESVVGLTLNGATEKSRSTIEPKVIVWATLATVIVTTLETASR